jgi:hypothetical protein
MKAGGLSAHLTSSAVTPLAQCSPFRRWCITAGMRSPLREPGKPDRVSRKPNLGAAGHRPNHAYLGPRGSNSRAFCSLLYL